MMDADDDIFRGLEGDLNLICIGSPEKLGTAVTLSYSGNKLPNTL